MKKIIFLFSLVLFSISSISQTTNVVYNTPYRTTGQSLWKQGTSGVFQIDHVFFDQTWNTNSTFGNIYNVAGQNFGARVKAETWGSIGAGFQVNFGTEKLNIDYNADMVINRPVNTTFNPGDEIVLKTSFNPYTPSDTSIKTDVYDANMRLWLKFGMGVKIHPKLCVFSCTEFDIVNFNMAVDTFDMIKAGNLTGVSILDGMREWPVEDAFPFSYTDPEDIITVDITLPSNSGANIYLDSNNLHSFVTPITPYFNTYFSIPKFIAYLHIPYVSAFFANLSNSYTAGPFYLNYTLMEAGFNLGLFHKQHLTLQPTMKGKLDLPTKIDYTVFNPINGTVYAQGFDSIINYTVGNNIKLKYPCNYDFIDITPSFNMENTFTNHTYDSIALDFVFDMLSFDMGMSAITVIPRICVPIYYPCPTWSNPLKWCSRTFCTPPVVFGGFHTGFGPLVHWRPNMFNIKYNWCNNSWNMQGFNSFNSMTPFRLESKKFSVDLNVNNVLCYGQNSGSATAVVTNGNPPFTYEWSNGNVVTSNSNSNTQTGLGAGTHFVIVRDAKECSVFDSKVITQPELPMTMTYNLIEPTCYDSYNGSINININGGTANYSYLWSNSSTNTSIINLDAGTYSVTITDNNSCSLSNTFTLTKPNVMISEIYKEDVLCKGENSGYAALTVTGGTPHYFYQWSNGDTSAVQTALTAGNYTITVSDFNSCQIIDTVEIRQPLEILNVSSNITNIDCFGASSGMINTTAYGGTPPYMYLWFNANNYFLNQSSANISNLPAGNYSLIVKDYFNCSDTANLIVTQPDPFQYQINTTDVLCKGLATGEIEISLTGATQPFTYNWSNGTNVEDIAGLVAGNYTLTLTDSHNCLYVIDTIISEPAELLSVSSIATNVLCKGDASGAVIASSEGGTTPYSYQWSNGSNSHKIEQVNAGTYTVTVTDANGCLYYSGAVVSEPNLPLTIHATLFPTSCFGYQDGSILVDLEGGTIPYTISWDNNTYILTSNQQSIEGLKSGIINLRITDANSCINFQTFTIGSPDSVIIDVLPSPVSCYGGNDGQVIVTVVGGTDPYTYLWSNNATTNHLEGVVSGTYLVSVTDANQCVYHTSTLIEEMPKNIVNAVIKPTTCKDMNDASIQLSVTGGAGNHHFLWSNGTTSPNAQNLASGFYNVVVSDDNQCEIRLDYQIEPNYTECVEIPSSFSPNNDGINDEWVIRRLDEYSNAKVQVYNKWGNLLYINQGIYFPWNGLYNGNPLPSEVYYYIIDLNNGDSPYTGTITILR